MDNYESNFSGSENSSQVNYNSNQMVGTKKGSLTYRNKNSNYDRKSGGGLSIENPQVVNRQSSGIQKIRLSPKN